MADLPLVADSTLKLRRGHFAARVEHGALRLPGSLIDTLRSLGVFSAAELVSYVAAFGAVLAEVLRWQHGDVEAARRELESSLRNHVDPVSRSPRRDTLPATGADATRSDAPARRIQRRTVSERERD